MNLAFATLKKTLSFLAKKKRRQFIKSCQNPQKYQEELLVRILKTSYSTLPAEPTDYLYYAENLSKITNQKILFFETTSGSTGNKKLIPYTKKLLKSFENMFLLWCHDILFHSDLKFESGKFFMSISPQIGEQSKDDRQYLSPLLRLLLKPFLISDPDKHRAQSAHDFFLHVCRDLINNRELEIISIWSPTYLLSLLDFIETHKEELNFDSDDVFSPHQHWPKLKLISCWTSAQARPSAIRLQQKFPHVLIQNKGLLLTEAPITIPWILANGSLPLLNETYLEFLDDNNNILKLHEIEQDQKYIVLTSQSNGLLRYNTQDEVLVRDFYYKTPILEFTGRRGGICDLAGEKLSDTILHKAYDHLNYNVLLVPDFSFEIPGYYIYVDQEEYQNEDLEAPLYSSHHYHLARTLKQLRPLQVVKVKQFRQQYLSYFENEGMFTGDIKEKILIFDLTEAKKFQAWIAREQNSFDSNQSS